MLRAHFGSESILPLVLVAGWESEAFAYEAFHPSIQPNTCDIAHDECG
jgi:hypothetical protein